LFFKIFIRTKPDRNEASIYLNVQHKLNPPGMETKLIITIFFTVFLSLISCAQKKGDVAEFAFTGTGVSFTGTWNKEGGKADIFVDNKFDRTIDTYFNYSNQQKGPTSIWHKFNLAPGTHKVRVEVKGEKRAESEGTKINLIDALVFITAPKKNTTVKFSFE
jgi:hypothetical protein